MMNTGALVITHDIHPPSLPPPPQARGAIIVQDALLAALDAGRLAGAALDVQDPEPPVAGSPLYTHPKVVLTPHIGWKRKETRQRLVDMVIVLPNRARPSTCICSLAPGPDLTPYRCPEAGGG